MLQNKLQVTVNITWVPETFQARLPLVASAYDRSCVGLRPTPKIPAAREKNLWYPEYRTQFFQMNPRMFARNLGPILRVGYAVAKLAMDSFKFTDFTFHSYE